MQTLIDEYFVKWAESILEPKLELSEELNCDILFYTVKPIGLQWPKIEQWAVDTFGEPGSVWDSHNFIWPEDTRWLVNDGKFWFRYEKDRTLLVLKWT